MDKVKLKVHKTRYVELINPTWTQLFANLKRLGHDDETWYRYTMGENLSNGPVKLIQRVKIAHSFLQCVKSVPLYHLKLAYVVLHMAVKEVFGFHC